MSLRKLVRAALRSLGLLAFIWVSTLVQAADIDLFAGTPTTGNGAPQIVFVLDTGASFSSSNDVFRCNIDSNGNVRTDGTGNLADFTQLDKTNGGVEQCALYKVIKALDTTTVKFKVAVMMFNAGQKPYDATNNTFSNTACSGNGGCLVMPMVDLSTANKINILSWIKAWTVSGNGNYNIKAPANRGDGATMQESWAYFMGKTGISGKDYSTIQPISACASQNIIFIGNNYDTQASPKDSTTSSDSPLKALNGTISTVGKRANPAATASQLLSIVDTIKTACKQTNNSSSFLSASVPTDENKGAYGLNWVAYMRAQGITTFSIGVQGPTCDATFAAYMEKMGGDDIGGGGFYPTSDFSSLEIALNDALSKIQTKNSVFASVSLPVSVNTQGTYLNQVYIGMFRPAQSFNPRWYGNLKQYKLGEVGTTLKLLDADSRAAIDSGSGFITACARSYWTPNSTDTYWPNNAGQSDCLTVEGAKASNYPDGNIVEKGGQAYRLRRLTPSNRTIKTCSPVFASCTSLVDFDTSLSTTTYKDEFFGATTSVPRNELISWARGVDTKGEFGAASTNMRPSVHGDVVHSRPFPVNFGTDSAPSVVVYYGANDGTLRAVNGNRGCTTGADGTCPPSTTVGVITAGNGTQYQGGDELWSFMPPEFFGNIKRLYDDAPAISYPGSTVSNATSKSYGFDGPISAVKTSTATTVLATMRRGGRVVYAFNVTTPTSPTLLWKRGCPNNLSYNTATYVTTRDDTDCSSDYSDIGQTWGALKTLYAVDGAVSGNPALLIMGGGYDTCEDFDAGTSTGMNHNCTSATKGKKVYIINSTNGAVIRAFNTDRAVVADATIVVDGSGKAKYAYTADLGGNVYRINLTSTTPSNWDITKIAALGCDDPKTAACTYSMRNRKFMFGPSVVTSDGGVTYDILLGSGDREKPLTNYTSSYNIQNYFFRLQDQPETNNWLTNENANCGGAYLCLASLVNFSAGNPPSDTALGSKKGWYLTLSGSTGEQVVTSAITIFGVTSFSTQQPQVYTANSCTSGLGTTRVYNISYVNGASANGNNLPYESVAGNGLPPSPVGGMVTLDNGSTVPFCIGCSGGTSPLESKKPTGLSTVTRPKSRTYWYLQK